MSIRTRCLIFAATVKTHAQRLVCGFATGAAEKVRSGAVRSASFAWLVVWSIFGLSTMTDQRGTLSIALLLLQGVLQCIILEISRKERSFDGVRLVVAVEMLKLLISLPCSAVLDMKLHRVTVSWSRIKNTLTN